MTDGTTKRRSMGKARQLRIFESHNGMCVTCGGKIDGVRDKWFIEHIRALCMGGADEDANCGPAHIACKTEKDREDAARYTKAKSVKQRHIGITAKKQKIQSAGFSKSDKPRKAVEYRPCTFYKGE